MDELISKLIRQHKTNCPFRIARGLGIQVRFMDLGQGTKGLYYKTLRRRFIVIHNGLSAEWQRFVCAHELGHDRLHKGINRFFLEENSYFSAGKLERQANRFAVALLSADAAPVQDEPLESYFLRLGIPPEVRFFLD